MKMTSLLTIFALFTLVSGLAVSQAYADHESASVSIPTGTSVTGCEDNNECYIPADVSVDVGGEVTWSNDDTAAHTVTSGTVEDGPDGTFDSSLFVAGNTFSHTFEEEGEYPYFCIVHPWMAGSVSVVPEAAAEEGEMMIEDEMMVEDEMMADDTEMMAEDEMMADDTEMMAEDEMMADDTEMMADDTEMMADDEMMDAEEGEMMEGEMMEDEKGGCLIATAAYGSELAPQVQALRELRDNTLLSTESGSSFMAGFNSIYYSFSPAIADLERENPAFREGVKLFITPMLSTLSVMTLADQGSESQVVALGLSVIALNLGLYIAAPAVTVWQIKKRI